MPARTSLRLCRAGVPVVIEYGWLEQSLDLHAEAQAFTKRFQNESTHSTGAIAEFSGFVKTTSDNGERLTGLEIQVWLEQAVLDTKTLLSNLVQKHQVTGLLALHRYGLLTPGEPIIYCAAAAERRHEAFAAVQQLVEHFKGDVAVWKREHFASTSKWVEGSPYRG